MPQLDAVAAADLKRSKAEESETEDSEVEDAEASSKKQKRKRKADGEGVMSEKTPKKRKADGEGVMPEKTPRKRKADCEGVMLEKTPVVDRFGFCTEDGHKYLDDTAPSDFHDSFHFNEGKQSELGNKYFSVRYVCMYVCILTYIIKCINTSFQDIYSHSFLDLSKLLLY